VPGAVEHRVLEMGQALLAGRDRRHNASDTDQSSFVRIAV
jgi:hypothetical protein